MATQQEVAERANVSISTVWRVVNAPDTVDPTTRRGVERAIEELGYVRRHANSTRKQSGQSISLIVPDLANPFFTMLIKGCEAAARPHGYRLMISDSENSSEQESVYLELDLEGITSGVVVVPSGSSSASIEEAIDRKYPMVLLDRTIADLDVSSITSDNYGGAYQATKYLLRLGHTQILFIEGDPGMSSAEERLAGFRDAMRESDVPVCEECIVSGGYDFETAHDVVRQSLDRGVRFTAVFASADVMAFGAKRALEERGLRIPADVSLVGYDDIPLSSSIGLTTVAQPALEMGRSAVTTLIHLVERRLERPTKLVLPPRLVIRETCSRLEKATDRRRTGT